MCSSHNHTLCLSPCCCSAKRTGGANGSIRLELGSAVRNMREAARLVDGWRRAINAKLAADPQVAHHAGRARAQHAGRERAAVLPA